MPIGGIDGPSGRRVRNVERALTASALLPTVAFAALGTLTVLLVVQMGISPLGVVVGPSARDGGQGVTTPRMSISIGPQRLPHSAPARDRETTADAPKALDLVRAVAQTSTIAPTRSRETTTEDAPTNPPRLTTLIFVRPVAHTITIARARGRETTSPHVDTPHVDTDEVESAAMKAADTDDALTSPTFIGRAVTIWEVTAAVEPQVQVHTDATDAPEVSYTLLARAATAPKLDPDDGKPQTPKNKDTLVASVKTPQSPQSPQNTHADQASEHANAAKNGR